MAKKKASRGKGKAAKKSTAKKTKKAGRGAKTKKKAASKGRKKARRTTKTRKKAAGKSAKSGKPATVKTQLREQWVSDEGSGLMEEYISSSSGSDHFSI